MKKFLIIAAFFFVSSFAEAKVDWFLVVLNGTYTGSQPVPTINYYTISSGEHLQVTARKHTSISTSYGVTVDWYVDSIYQFTAGDTVEFSQPGLIFFKTGSNFSWPSIQLKVPCISNLPSSTNNLLISVVNGNYVGTAHDTLLYDVTENYCELRTTETSPCGQINVATKWLIDNVYYSSTLPYDFLSINHSGLISAVDTVNNIVSLYKILLQFPSSPNVDASSSLPFPFSNSPNINPNNLRYTIINPLGQIMEQGKFSGEIILRSGNHQLHPGIYFVIYSDALDNRQVLTDKVFVTNQ